jgi:hypothetical protein
MPYDVLVKKLDSLSEIQKKSVFDYINFLIYQNTNNANNSSSDNSDETKRRLEYLDSLENKEITSRNIQEINQYISEIRNEERVF